MARGRRGFAREQVLAAIRQSQGLVQAVADRLGCHWLTAKRYIDRWESTRDAMVEERERLLDLAENRLFAAVDRGEAWAVNKVLATLGKKRGYSERHEITGEDGNPIQAILVAPRRFDSAKEWQEYVQEVPQGSGAPAPATEGGE